jgi:hypothetical protein
VVVLEVLRIRLMVDLAALAALLMVGLAALEALPTADLAALSALPTEDLAASAEELRAVLVAQVERTFHTAHPVAAVHVAVVELSREEEDPFHAAAEAPYHAAFHQGREAAAGQIQAFAAVDQVVQTCPFQVGQGQEERD